MKKPPVVVCHLCERPFKYKSSLKTHMKRHKYFRCEHCPLNFETLDLRERHMRQSHKVINQCRHPGCGKSFKSECELQAHHERQYKDCV